MRCRFVETLNRALLRIISGQHTAILYNLSLIEEKPSICCFGAIEKRRIATALLLCPEDGARGLFSYLLCFFLLPTTAVPMAALPLTSIRTSNKAGLLVSPVCGMVY